MIDPVSPIDRIAPLREAEEIRRREEQRKVEAHKESETIRRMEEEGAFRERKLQAERIRIRDQQDRIADEARRRVIDAAFREELRRNEARREEELVQERFQQEKFAQDRLSEERLRQERLQEKILEEEVLKRAAVEMRLHPQSAAEEERVGEEIAIEGEDLTEGRIAATPLEHEAIRRYQDTAMREEYINRTGPPLEPEHRIDLLA